MQNDSNKYPNSVFYVEWGQVNAYSPIDQELIKMMYSSGLWPGADESEIRTHFQ